MQLIIDTREKKESVDIITNIVNTAGYTVSQKLLDVGDLAIADDNGEILALFERKTCKDLAASINDGRYNEQKERMLSSSMRWKGYILEGKYPKTGIKFPKAGKSTRTVLKKTYYSIITGFTLRDGLIVYNTENVNETGEFLAQMLKKIPDYLKVDKKTSYNEALINSISTVRKENMTPVVCYLAQLSQIPGVSYNFASCIARKYDNLSSLLLAKEEELSNITINSRRLGKVVAKRIVEYLHYKIPKKTIIITKK
uniref:ERCC4 domain-containing protein n=1 Tax=viral metagenome TaxID=1070528 RepID=A0A6C0J5N6_9ZZZZ